MLQEPSPKDTICEPELSLVGALQALMDQQLMAEGENLCMECRSRSQALPNRMEQREDDGEHDAGNLSGSASKFNWLNQYRVFSRDSPGKSKKSFQQPTRGSGKGGSRRRGR